MFGFSMDEATYERRGFSPGAPKTQAQLVRSASSYLTGSNFAVEETRPEKLKLMLDSIELDIRGFAPLPSGLSSLETFELDAGAGRALWFACCADPERLAARVSRFDEARREPLWSGIGLASTYAGGVDGAVIDKLLQVAGPYVPAVAVGVAEAVHTRALAGNPTPHMDMVARRVWGQGADSLHREVTSLWIGLPTDGRELAGGRPSWEVFIERLFERARALNRTPATSAGHAA